MTKHPLNARRAALVGVVLLLVLGVISSEPLHRAILDLFAAAEQVMREYPRSGMLLFFALAGFSAMLSFFSSAALVPVGVFVWGPTVTLLLLWSGGIVGGVLGYWFARTLGRRAVKRMFPAEPLRKYETFFSTRADWRTIVLFRLALQSELPSYVLGLVRYPFVRYLPIIMGAEALFVLFEVYLGAAFLDRSVLTFVGALLISLLLIVWAWRRLHHEIAAGG